MQRFVVVGAPQKPKAHNYVNVPIYADFALLCQIPEVHRVLSNIGEYSSSSLDVELIG